MKIPVPPASPFPISVPLESLLKADLEAWLAAKRAIVRAMSRGAA